jgi:hypothetical protein
MAEALRRAGPAIIASGSTVIVALLMLTAAELNWTKGLGPVLAIGVAVGMFSMLTLLPALLVTFPRGVFWLYQLTYGSAEPTYRGMWARVGWRIAPQPRRVWVITVVVLGILAAGLTGLKAHGLTNAQEFRGHPESVTGETVLTRHFPAGAGEPVIVIGNQNAAAQLRSAFAATPGIAAVTPPAARAGHAYLEGTLTSPPDSQAAYTTIGRVRSAVRAVPRAGALVGGSTAINLDVQRASAHDRNLILPLTLVAVFIILGLLLRALVAPLILIAAVVLSFAAALRVSAVFFNHVFGFGGADTGFPPYVFVFLVALGIDYNIFLMTRVREEAIRRDARRGALVGLAATGGVITSAGCVLAATFAVLATLPSTSLTEIGFSVAFGILLDTIIVRSVLVTALNLDLGHWMCCDAHALADGDAEGQRVFTAARRLCAAVLTSPSAVTTLDTALALGCAARLPTAVLRVPRADVSALVWACHWPRAWFTKAVRFALTSLRSAVIWLTVPAPTFTCVSLSSDARKAVTSAHRAASGGEVAGAADVDDEATPEDVPPDGVPPPEPHADASSARPYAIAASFHRAGLVAIPCFTLTRSRQRGVCASPSGGHCRLPGAVITASALSTS